MPKGMMKGGDLQQEANRLLLANYAPASVVVDTNLEILHVHGHTSPYLALTPGKTSSNVLTMAREDLRPRLATALAQARQQGLAVKHTGIPVTSGGDRYDVTLEVFPLKGSCFLVVFQQTPAFSTRTSSIRSSDEHTDRSTTRAAAARRIATLDQEITATRAQMAAALEERDAMNEELQTANEEIRASNEELHVINEELISANQQLKVAQEYAEAIVETVREPLVVLDADLRVQRANTAFYQCFRVGPHETEGHFLSDLGHGQWNIPRLRTLLEQVLATNHSFHDFEVESTFPQIGHKIMVLGAHRIFWEGSGVPMLLLAIEDVTERLQAEREKRAATRQLQLQAELIDLAHDTILVRDPQSRILSWNRGAEELYGWTAQEAVGQVSHSLLQTRFPLPREAIETLLEQERQWEGELVHTRRDSARVTVASRQVLVRDEMGKPRAILEINRDITQQRRLELLERQVHAEMQARLTLLQRILDELPSSVYLVRGHDARLVLANRATTAVWGASWLPGQPMDAFLTMNGIRIFGMDGRLLVLEQLATQRAVRQGETVRHHQEIIRHPDGTTLPMLVNAVALEASHLLNAPSVPGAEDPCGEGELAALIVQQDVSALKETERLKDEFLSVAAHELHTPLAVLKGFADMLLLQTSRGNGPHLADWQVEALEDIDLAVQRLDTLTDDLLDVARLQAGRFILHRGQTDLVKLTRRVVAQRQLTTERHTLSFHPAMEQVIVHSDAGRIEQVLANLLSNAIKYSPDGGPIKVTMHQEAGTHEVLLSIQDHGIGIPVHEQARLFGRFARAENASTQGIGGTGLGLYLCRELVEWHGGRIWFTSTEGMGTTFFIALPLASDAARTIPLFQQQG
jgi:PAS domain S-box-containing protein